MSKEIKNNKVCYLISGVYHWMISNLPYRIMYKHVCIDSQHKILLPKYGWSKNQIVDAEKLAKELSKNINWE